VAPETLTESNHLKTRSPHGVDTFLITLLTFIRVLANASAEVLTVILILRFPPILIAVGTALLLFQWLLKRLSSFEQKAEGDRRRKRLLSA
jgi:hypothetical protein